MTSPASKRNNVSTVPIDSIFASPENDEIYGAIDPTDIDLVNLANDIAQNGIREPIHVSTDGHVISGHRRLAASKLVKLNHVTVLQIPISRVDYTSAEWKQKLVPPNLQRVKSSAVRLNEVLVNIDSDLAYSQLVQDRVERDVAAPPEITIRGTKDRRPVGKAKQAFLLAAQTIIERLKEYWPLTVRQIHYQLLNEPPLRHSSKPSSHYANDKASYHDLCNLLSAARVYGDVEWKSISDETRPITGTCFSKDVAAFFDLQFHNFLRWYRRDLMQSQPDHIELIVEKLTVQGIINPIANQYCVPMTVGRGYCSLSPRKAIVERFERSGKDRLVLLIASDFDPDGEEIAQSFARSCRDDFNVEVVARKILLTSSQIKKWKLPPNGMEAKQSSKQFAKFVSQYKSNRVYELEAVSPKLMQATVKEAIEGVIDSVAFNNELALEKQDARILQAAKNIAVEQLRLCLPDLFRT